MLDLFAGTGAFGFEALSRGAASVVFVDIDRRMAETLNKTCRAWKIDEQVLILTMSADRALRKLADTSERFAIIFLDPPYGTEWVSSVVGDPILESLFASDGLLIIEREEKASDLAIPKWFRREFGRKYGDTVVEIFRYDGGDPSVFP